MPSIFSDLFREMLLSDIYNEKIVKSNISLMKSILDRLEERYGQDIATRETILELKTLKAELIKLWRQRIEKIEIFERNGFVMNTILLIIALLILWATLFNASISLNGCVPFLLIAVLALHYWNHQKTKARISARYEKELSKFKWISVFDSHVDIDRINNDNNINVSSVFNLKKGQTELLDFFTDYVEPLNQRHREEKSRSDCWFYAMCIFVYFFAIRAYYFDVSRNLNPCYRTRISQ